MNNGIAPRLKTIFIFPPEEEALNRSKAANLVSRTPDQKKQEPLEMAGTGTAVGGGSGLIKSLT
jgi:hypothetical protein